MPTKEEDRIKAIPGKDMSEAIKSMNTYLKGKELDLVVVKDTTKTEALANLLVPIAAAIEAGEAETLPDEVIAFYNDHMVVEEDAPEKPAKEKKAKKEKKPAAPKKPSNEQVSYDMVKAGKSDADIVEHFKSVYAGKGKDDAFISKRAAIYTNIAKRKFAGEDDAFSKKWAAEKEAAKPKKEPKVKKETPAKKTKTASGGTAPAKAAPKKVVKAKGKK